MFTVHYNSLYVIIKILTDCCNILNIVAFWVMTPCNLVITLLGYSINPEDNSKNLNRPEGLKSRMYIISMLKMPVFIVISSKKKKTIEHILNEEEGVNDGCYLPQSLKQGAVQMATV